MRRAVRVLVLLLACTLALAACGKKKHDSAASTSTSTAPSTTAPVQSSTTIIPPAPNGNSTNTTTVQCQPVPAKSTASAPDGAPPVAAGSRWFESKEDGGIRVAAAASPQSLENFQTRQVRSWLAEGWRELTGESEPGREVEGVYQKGTIRVGVRARNVYCDPAWIEVRMSVVHMG